MFKNSLNNKISLIWVTRWFYLLVIIIAAQIGDVSRCDSDVRITENMDMLLSFKMAPTKYRTILLQSKFDCDIEEYSTDDDDEEDEEDEEYEEDDDDDDEDDDEEDGDEVGLSPHAQYRCVSSFFANALFDFVRTRKMMKNST